jgi:hypothetical protein
MDTLPTKRGRPVGREYPIVKQVRIGTEDAADLAHLCEEWRCKEAEAMRRAIREAAAASRREKRRRARYEEPDPETDAGYRLHGGQSPWPED